MLRVITYSPNSPNVGALVCFALLTRPTVEKKQVDMRRQTDRQVGRQTDRQVGRQVGRQTDRRYPTPVRRLLSLQGRHQSMLVASRGSGRCLHSLHEQNLDAGNTREVNNCERQEYSCTRWVQRIIIFYSL